MLSSGLRRVNIVCRCCWISPGKMKVTHTWRKMAKVKQLNSQWLLRGNFHLTCMFAAQLGETGGRRRRGAISSRQEQSSSLNGQETFTDAAQRQKRLNGEQYPPTHLSQNSSSEDFTAFTDFLLSFSKVHWQKVQRAELETLYYFQTFSIKILICSFSNVWILSQSPSFEKYIILECCTEWSNRNHFGWWKFMTSIFS